MSTRIASVSASEMSGVVSASIRFSTGRRLFPSLTKSAWVGSLGGCLPSFQSAVTYDGLGAGIRLRSDRVRLGGAGASTGVVRATLLLVGTKRKKNLVERKSLR